MTLLSLETEEEERLIYSHWKVTQGESKFQNYAIQIGFLKICFEFNV